MNQTEREAINNLAIEMSQNAGKSLLKVPGMSAVLITMVGDGVPLGVIVYSKKKQGADTVTNAIARLSEHITVLANGLTGDDDGQAAHGSVGREGEVSGEPVVRSPAHEDTPEVPRSPADGQQGERDTDTSR